MMKKIKNENIKRIGHYLKMLLKYLDIVLILILLYVVVVPWVYSHTYGNKLVNNVLKNITANSTSPDDTAISIMSWEHTYFQSPYLAYNPNSILKNIVKINGKYHLFIRTKEVPWIIHSRLANCGEYAMVFVYLMNKKGYKARLITAPGEDHAWAEYFSHGIWITVDPSEDIVVVNKSRFAKGKHWSYIISENFDGSDKKDITVEYVPTGILKIQISTNGHPVKDAYVIIKDPYLMKLDPKRYKSPRVVVINKTNEKGIVTFKLGKNEYIVKIIKPEYLLFARIYTKNVRVFPKNETKIYIDVAKDKGKFGCNIALPLQVFGKLYAN